MTPVLQLEGVAAAYGPFRALFDVSLAIGPGEAVALVGSNGAGKTTVARVASGLLRPTDGQVLVDGADLTGARTHRFARAGVAHAPEGRSVFATLTVEENLALAFGRVQHRREVRRSLDRAFDLFPRLGERRVQRAGTLSGGQQRLLSLARVMVDVPRVLVADELSLGLAPIVIREVYEGLARLRSEGVALLVIEQRVALAVGLCDRVVVLEHGSVGWTGPSAEASAVVGRSFDPTAGE